MSDGEMLEIKRALEEIKGQNTEQSAQNRALLITTAHISKKLDGPDGEPEKGMVWQNRQLWLDREAAKLEKDRLHDQFIGAMYMGAVLLAVSLVSYIAWLIFAMKH